MSRKQTKGTIHNRNNLPRQVEDPLPEPEEEAPPKEPLPERRIPYSLHVVSHFPQGKHLHEESNARKFIQDKIVMSFENFEDMIRHIEVNLQVSDGFHRNADDGKRSKSAKLAADKDGELIQDPAANKILAPYIFKVTVSLKNHHTIVLANAEKHAQPTLTEGLDHMVDVIKKSLREEKDKDIQARRKAKGQEPLLSDLDSEVKDARLEAAEIVEEIEAEKDRQMEEVYKQVEAANE